MPLATFACTVEQFHGHGFSIVSCPALGWKEAFVTDDFGRLQSVYDPVPLMISNLSGAEH